MEYEAMDEDTVQPAGNMIPIALATLGILLGTAGLYFGFNANKRLNSIDTSIQESSTNTLKIEKSFTFYDTRIAELEKHIQEYSEVIQRLRVYNSQSEQAIKTLSSELNKNREQIVRTAKETTGASPKPEAEPTYVIVSGDTFAKIAAKLGVSLQAIIDANPDADPRRLAIGQKIVIPAE